MRMLGSLFVLLLGAVICGVGDLWIRAHGLDGVNGISADSWNTTGGWLMIGGTVAAIASWIRPGP